jgi:hypothetical protein
MAARHLSKRGIARGEHVRCERLVVRQCLNEAGPQEMAGKTERNPNESITVLSLGAGVQSTTMLLMAERGEISRPVEAIFADTGWESAAVYHQVAWLREQTSIPIHTVSVGNLREAALAGDPRAWMPFYLYNRDGRPAMLRRQCTRHFNLDPIRRRVRELRDQFSVRHVVQQIGISLDEAAHRMRSSGVQYITNDYPLIEMRMTRWDCRNWLVRHGFPIPAKSSCIGCPFRADWHVMTCQSPDAWADAVAFDAAIRRSKGQSVGDAVFLHRSRVPLDEVTISKSQDRGQRSFLDECEGMCGV